MISASEKLRVGGDFELALNTLLLPDDKQQYTEFDAPHTIKVDTGRSALYLAAKVIQEMGGTGKVWLPAYGCESISNAFISAGYDIQYYSVGQSLLEVTLPIVQIRPSDTILFIHYFGHLNKNMLANVPAYRQKGIWVIEDFVQAGLIKNPPLSGDFAITSYRKLLCVPDGALLASQQSIKGLKALSNIAQANEAFISAKVIAKLLRANNADAQRFLPIMDEAEQLLAGTVSPRLISSFSSWAIANLDLQKMAELRRENWQLMLSAINSAELDSLIKPVFSRLEEMDVPLGFPVMVVGGQRDALKCYLIDQDIFCPIHWDLGFLPDAKQFPTELQMSASLLTLPIDQRVSKAHIEYMVSSINRFFKRQK